MEEKKWIAIARETLKTKNGGVAFIEDKPYKVKIKDGASTLLINEFSEDHYLGRWYDKFQFVEVPKEEDMITFEVGKMKPALCKELIDIMVERAAREISESIATASVAPKFKDGDFVTLDNKWVSIYKGARKSMDCISYYCGVGLPNTFHDKDLSIGTDTRGFGYICLSTDSEKQVLLDAIKAAGKRWNAEAKRIEDLEWKPQRGEVVKTMCGIFIFDEDSEPFIKGLNRLFYNTDGVIEISKFKFMCEKSQLEPTTPEERGEFFESLTKAGWKYNSRKVELKKVEKPAIKGFDFSKLRRGDFVSYKGTNGEEWFSVVDKVENGILYEMVTTLGICSIEGLDQPIRYIDPASVKVLNRKID